MKLGTTRYLLAQATTDIRRSVKPSAAVVILVSLIILAALLGVFANVQVIAGQIASSVQMAVYVSDDGPGLLSITDQLLAMPGAVAAEPRTRDEELSRILSQFPEYAGIMESLGENPLQDVVLVTLASPDDASPFSEAVSDLPGVDDVVYGKEVADDASRLVRAMRLVCWAGTFLMVLAIAVTIGSVVGLSVQYRSREIEIMRLVGATEWFIRLPFLVEGLAISVGLALVASAVFALAYFPVVGALRALVPFIPWAASLRSVVTICLELIAISASSALVATLVTMRRTDVGTLAGLTVVVLALVINCGLVPGTAYAGFLEESVQKLNELKGQIVELRSLISRSQSEEKQVLDSLDTKQRELSEAKHRQQAIANDIASTNASIASVESRIARMKEEIVAVEARISDHRHQVAEQMRRIQRLTRSSGIAVLSTSCSEIEYELNREAFKAIFIHTNELVRKLEQDLSSLDAKRTSLAAEQARLYEARRSLSKLLANQEDSLGRVAKIIQEKTDLLAKVRSEKALNEQALEEFERSSEQLEKLIIEYQAREAEQKAVSQVWGESIRWPVEGEVVLGFTTAASGGEIHNGVDIAADEGAPVVAVRPGVVVASGWVRGYGNTVILNHGDGFATVYGNCASVKVSKSDLVQEGQVIGEAGSTGHMDRPGVHFEVRKDGVPVDPTLFLQ